MENIYAAVDFADNEKIYVLVEFPYPSGAGLHVGHAFTMTGADVYARYQRMRGKNVLFPMGWDAFGLPTENYAISTGRKPQDITAENVATYRRQMDSLGLSFDWSREISTTDPDYYRWTQWIFTRLVEHDLAFKQEMPINWCPKDKVGLANEEVINGRCERCGTEVVRRWINQWVVKITAYADRLIEGLKETQFIEKVKTVQINWIGRSEGTSIRFRVKGKPDVLEVFTTRPDTLWGATFMVLSPEHPMVSGLLDDPAIAAYVRQAQTKSDLERSDLSRSKDGVFSGLYAINPANSAEIPIWISDFVLSTYGTGAIMSVPAHDQRDYEFARNYALPIIPIIAPDHAWDYQQAAYEGKEGTLINSGFINGMRPGDAIAAVTAWLEDKGFGKKAVSYHLRDWIFSRQHYWGEPIPMIHCERCGWVPVPDDQLPVVLPPVEKYQPTDTGESPLANIVDWVNTTCPKCDGPARRETDTMPNWAGSDWYYLRFVDPRNDHEIADMQKQKYWMPVDVYIGGDEHNTLHLLYSRFIYQFLHDIKAVPNEIPEPYIKRLSHGVILGPDGARMSKTHGNVIVPDDVIKKHGADVLRTYLLFLGPFDATMPWNERTLMGVKRFLRRFDGYVQDKRGLYTHSSREVKAVVNQLGKTVADDIAAFKFNTAIAKIMESLNQLIASDQAVSGSELRTLAQVIAPFAPFLAEKAWRRLGGEGSVHASMWPKFDPGLVISEEIEIPIQVNGKLRGVLHTPPNAGKEEIIAEASSLESVARFLQKGSVVKVIYVEGKTVNFVVK